MKLLKIIIFFFAVYFIRRFIQFYKVVQETYRKNLEMEKARAEVKPENSEKIVEAEFKVVDR